jgi:alpha-beta hydrolase superfamily lysophospholipase
VRAVSSLARADIEASRASRHTLLMISSNETGASAKPSYADHPTWRLYQPYFPESMRCTPETMPREEWWSWRGLDVHLDRAAAPNAKLKVIVLHGAGAYGRVMAPAAVLAQRYGYETVAPDLPGYGLTRVPWSQFDYPSWVDCVCDLIDAEIARDGMPVALFGVSLGGLLAYQAAAKSRKVVGLIATTLADMREESVRRDFARHPLLGTFGISLLDSLSFALDGLPLPMAYVSKMDNISNDPTLSRLCKRDRLGGGNWVPARFLRTLLATTPAIEPEDFDVCPVLLAHPGVDHMTDIAASRRFFERLRGKKRMVVLEGASHMPTEHPGVDQLEAAVLESLASFRVTIRERAA